MTHYVNTASLARYVKHVLSRENIVPLNFINNFNLIVFVLLFT